MDYNEKILDLAMILYMDVRVKGEDWLFKDCVKDIIEGFDVLSE